MNFCLSLLNIKCFILSNSIHSINRAKIKVPAGAINSRHNPFVKQARILNWIHHVQAWVGY